MLSSLPRLLTIQKKREDKVHWLFYRGIAKRPIRIVSPPLTPCRYVDPACGVDISTHERFRLLDSRMKNLANFDRESAKTL